MNFLVIEIFFGSSNLQELRTRAGDLIRDGDALYLEEGRLFLVLAGVSMSGAAAALERLTDSIEAAGGTVKPWPIGSDEVTDSLYRRAGAQLIPVSARTGA